MSTSSPAGVSRTSVTVAAGKGGTTLMVTASCFFKSPVRDELDQAGGIEPTMPVRLKLRVELVDQSCRRKLRSIRAGFFDRNPQVFAHEVHREAEVEFSID